MQTLPRVVPTLLLAAVLAGCAATDNPTPREVPTYTIEQLMGTARISTASLSADGETVLFTSDASGVPNAYAVPFGGGEPVQLTHSTGSLHTHGYFPSDERFLYSADEDGNELSHIYVRNPDGSAEDLTPAETCGRSSWAGHWTAARSSSQATSATPVAWMCTK